VIRKDKEVLMRRNCTCVLAVAVLGWLSPSVFAQYYYNPYSPPMYNPAPGYGYANPMMMRPPAYYYPPMPMQQPAYYPPMQQQPAYYYPSRNSPTMYNYGPLLTDAPAPKTTNGSAKSIPALPSGIAKTNGITRTDAQVDGGCPGGCAPGAPLPNVHGPASCGDGCNSCGDACNDSCAPKVPLAPLHPCGHFFGMVGLEFLVPYPQNRTAFSTTGAGAATTSTNFTQQVDYAPTATVGYVCHNGWGIRGDFLYLHANTTLTTSNADPTAVITTPGTAPFLLVSPSATLAAGIGTDQFTFTRSYDFKLADLEVVKECGIFDMFFTFGAGARYAEVTQSYTATRVNIGGVNAAGTVAVTADHEDLGFRSLFHGMGPTLSMEFFHPIKGSCFSFYGTIRGSALFGVEQFHQEHNAQNVVTMIPGAPVSTAFSSITDSSTHRTVPMVDSELGIQIGKRFGHCYLFGRVGAVYNRWWDVGNPVASTGSLDIVGGTAKLGIIY
jgi:Legionella pneumophila major outer membrane protein precursor